MLKITTYSHDSKQKGFFTNIKDIVNDFRYGHSLGRQLFIRDFKALYRQSYLGYVWAFLPPLINSLIWIILNSSKVVKISDTPMPYPVFVIIGTILWQTFSESITEPIRSITVNKSILTKLNFPREAVIISAFYSALANFLIKFVVLAITLSIIGINISFYTLLLPVGIIGLILLGFCIGIILLPISLLYNDISKGIPIVLQLFMYLTPVIYPSPSGGFLKKLLVFNPVAPVLNAARNWIAGIPADNIIAFCTVVFISLFIIIIGLIIFKIAMPIVIERIGS